MAEREDRKRQLNVHGLTPEFLDAGAGGTMETQLLKAHGELVKHGLKFRPQNIIRARPTSDTTRNDKTLQMRVTYDSAETKSVVIKAAKAGHIWNSRQKKEKGKLTYFKEIPPPNRHSQVKRKHHDETRDEMESNPKKAKSKPITDSDSTPDNGRAEEEEEEKKRQEFVARELRVEERDAETKFIA